MKKPLFFLLIVFVFLKSMTAVYADAREDFLDQMEIRQQSVSSSLDQLDIRIKGINSNDPKKEKALELLDDAEDAVDAFKDLDPANHIENLGENRFEADTEFRNAETRAVGAMNAVNRYLLTPDRPGGGEGTVPEGGLLEDFVPQFIRLLFRFVSAAILIAIVVSAVMLITAMDSEEKATKARQMLYWSLLGFAFVALAFAIVKAITQIDFFGFI